MCGMLAWRTDIMERSRVMTAVAILQTRGSLPPPSLVGVLFTLRCRAMVLGNDDNADEKGSQTMCCAGEVVAWGCVRGM